MDCCSSTTTASYADYRQHAMNGNFCYPYAPSMLRSASPYPLAAGGGGGGGARYGTSYRSSPLPGGGGYHGAASPHAPYDGYDKYYGGGYGHHGPSGYGSGYYGNYHPSAYRDYGPGHYNSHYYHQSQSPYARAGGGAASPMYGGYLYPSTAGRHYGATSSLQQQQHHPFGGSRDPYPYHGQREHQQQQQYSSFANYPHLPPYRNGTHPDHPAGGKSHHHHPQQQQQQQFPIPFVKG